MGGHTAARSTALKKRPTSGSWLVVIGAPGPKWSDYWMGVVNERGREFETPLTGSRS
jgi:hypothetical protein